MYGNFLEKGATGSNYQPTLKAARRYVYHLVKSIWPATNHAYYKHRHSTGHSGSQLLSHQAIMDRSLNTENSSFILSFLCSSLLISSQPPLGAVQALNDSHSIFNHIFLTSLKISRGKKKKKGITGRQSTWVGTGVSWKVHALIKGVATMWETLPCAADPLICRFITSLKIFLWRLWNLTSSRCFFFFFPSSMWGSRKTKQKQNKTKNPAGQMYPSQPFCKIWPKV